LGKSAPTKSYCQQLLHVSNIEEERLPFSTHFLLIIFFVSQFFSTANHNDTISREEYKTIFSSLRISEMTLSNYSHFWGFFLSPESHPIGFCKSYKVQHFRLVISRNLAGPFGVTKSRKMTCWGLVTYGLRQARIGQAPVSHLP
jgi:hypothetical protein